MNNHILLWYQNLNSKDIFERIKDAGISNIFINIPWTTIEQEQNKFTFDITDDYINMVNNYGFNLIINTLSLYPEFPSYIKEEWKYKTKVNTSMPIAVNLAVKEFKECYYNAVINFCERYKNSNINFMPNFGNTEYFYPQFNAEDTSGHLWCFDDASILEFQEYVRNKYTLDEYNFYTDSSYTDWEQVIPIDLNGEVQLDNYGNVQDSFGLDIVNAVNGNMFTERLSGNIRGFAITNAWYSKRIYDYYIDYINLVAPYNTDNTIWMMVSYLDNFRRHPYTRISSGMYDLLNILCKIKNNLEQRNINYNVMFPLIYKSPCIAYDDLFFSCLSEYYKLNIWVGSQTPYNIEHNLYRSLKYGFKGVFTGLQSENIDWEFKNLKNAQQYADKFDEFMIKVN